MTKSGTHDNDPFNFVEVAMKEFHGFTPIAIYYSFTRCEEHSDTGSVFQPTMDNRLKCSSLTVLSEDSDNMPNSDGSQLTKPSTADQHLSTHMEQGKAMVLCYNHLWMNRRKTQKYDDIMTI